MHTPDGQIRRHFREEYMYLSFEKSKHHSYLEMIRSQQYVGVELLSYCNTVHKDRSFLLAKRYTISPFSPDMARCNNQRC
jgi:hypothetical protein